MRFLVDAQLPPTLARWLAERGHDAQHVSDHQMQSASDTVIWDYAVAISAAIVTKDEDFAQRKALESDGPAIVWVRLRNARRREIIMWFERMLPHVLVALERGETLIEVI